MQFPGGLNVNIQQDENQDNAVIKKIEETKTVEELSNVIQKKDIDITNKDNQIFKLTLEKHFEYTYRLIFKSQIVLLQDLQTFQDGLSMGHIEKHFDTVRSMQEVLNKWDVSIYIKFLFDQNLIERDNLTHKLKLTSIGDAFLKYLIINNYNYNLEKNL